MKNLRIGLITQSYFPNISGGSDISVKILAENLAKNGYETTVFAFDGTKNLVERINGVKVVRTKILTTHYLFLTLMPYVATVMRRWEDKIDVFHVYNVWPLSGAGLYRYFGGKKPVVATLNNYYGFCPISQVFGQCWNCNYLKEIKCAFNERPTLKAKVLSIPYASVYPLLIMLSKKIDSYIALSKYVKRAYTQFGFSPEKIKVIPNFADNNFLNKLDVQKVEHSFVILYVGRLSDEKGVDILLKAFSKLSQKEKHAKLVLVGAGPATKRYMHLVDHLNITEKTRFLGKLSNNDVWKVYATADVMVHPAIWPEPFGRTLLEAMSCNIPLIVSSAGAPPEIIENAGVVFESGNIDDLLEKIQTVMKNSHQLNQMKSSCSIVLGKYALDKILYEILALYTDLVNTYAE